MLSFSYEESKCVADIDQHISRWGVDF